MSLEIVISLENLLSFEFILVTNMRKEDCVTSPPCGCNIPAPDNWPGSGSRSSSLPWSGPWHQGMSSLSRLQPLPDSVPSRSEGRG